MSCCLKIPNDCEQKFSTLSSGSQLGHIDKVGECVYEYFGFIIHLLEFSFISFLEIIFQDFDRACVQVFIEVFLYFFLPECFRFFMWKTNSCNVRNLKTLLPQGYDERIQSVNYVTVHVHRLSMLSARDPWNKINEETGKKIFQIL